MSLICNSVFSESLYGNSAQDIHYLLKLTVENVCCELTNGTCAIRQTKIAAWSLGKKLKGRILRYG